MVLIGAKLGQASRYVAQYKTSHIRCWQLNIFSDMCVHKQMDASSDIAIWIP